MSTATETGRARTAWVKEVTWKVFATATFPIPVSQERAVRIFGDLINAIERRLRTRVAYVYGLEQYSRDYQQKVGWHFHFALTALADIPGDELVALWSTLVHRGRKQSLETLLRIEPYDPDKSGLEYILKMADSHYESYWDVGNLQYFNGAMLKPAKNRADRKRAARWNRQLLAASKPA